MRAEFSVTSAGHAAIMQTAEYIRNNLHKKLPLEQLAKMPYMSPSKFKYVFKAVTGFSLTLPKNSTMKNVKGWTFFIKP